jgi:hypothetical protein
MAVDTHGEPWKALTDYFVSDATLTALLGTDPATGGRAAGPKHQVVAAPYPRLSWSNYLTAAGQTDIESEQSINATIQVEFYGDDEIVLRTLAGKFDELANTWRTAVPKPLDTTHWKGLIFRRIGPWRLLPVAGVTVQATGLNLLQLTADFLYGSNRKQNVA